MYNRAFPHQERSVSLYSGRNCVNLTQFLRDGFLGGSRVLVAAVSTGFPMLRTVLLSDEEHLYRVCFGEITAYVCSKMPDFYMWVCFFAGEYGILALAQ